MTPTTSAWLAGLSVYILAALVMGLTLHFLADAHADFEARKAAADGDAPHVEVKTSVRESWRLYALGLAWPLVPLYILALGIYRGPGYFVKRGK